MTRTVRLLLCALLLFTLVPTGAGAKVSAIQQKIEAQRRKAEALQAQLHAKKMELQRKQAVVHDLQSQLDATNAAIGQVSAHIDDLDSQERSTRHKADWNSIQLDAAQRSLRTHDGALKQRLVEIYENGDLSYVDVLLSAHSFTEFVERWEDLRLILAANEKAVRERKAAAQKVASVQAELNRTQIELSSEEQGQARAKNQLSALADERRNLVAVADQERRHVATQVAQIEELSAGEEAQLEALIRQRQAELEAQRRAKGIAGEITTGTPGTFAWPISGTITSPFGWRSNPFGGAPEFHSGLDIAAPQGTTITASAGGTVMMAQWYGGYGNYILIDDGGGYSTGYGHLSAFYVSAGQQVKQGQAIGAVGCTGSCTGPHVHFEIRINGKPVDPAPRLH